MSKRKPPNDRTGPIAGSDWSVGLNSPTSIGQARLLQTLGRALRREYEGLVSDPLPDQLRALVEGLNADRGPTSKRKPAKRRPPDR